MANESTGPGMDERPRWRRDVALFLSGQMVSLFGSMLVQYAVMWYLTLTTKDGVVLALSTVFGFLPQAVVSIFGGVWADRHNRKFLVIGADAAIAVATLALAVLMFQGHTDLWLIDAALAVRSVGAGIQTPAVAALIPQIVPAGRLLAINGLNQSIQAGMMLVAPPVAAVLYATLPLAAILGVDVVTAAVGIGLLALVPVGMVIHTALPSRMAAKVLEVLEPTDDGVEALVEEADEMLPEIVREDSRIDEPVQEAKTARTASRSCSIGSAGTA